MNNPAVHPSSTNGPSLNPKQFIRWFPEPIAPLSQALLPSLSRMADLSAGQEDPAVQQRLRDGEAVFYIRPYRGAALDGYVKAESNACALSLRQWVAAGIGDRYPLAERTHAERDLVCSIHRDRIRSSPDVAMAMARYAECRDREQELQFKWLEWGLSQDDIAEEMGHDIDTRNCLALLERAKADLQVRYRIESWGHYETLSQVLRDGHTIQTLTGLQHALQGRVYALLGHLEQTPFEPARRLPPVVREVFEACHAAELAEYGIVNELSRANFQEMGASPIISLALKMACADLKSALRGEWVEVE